MELDSLLTEVHIIAYYYKWGEDKILSLSRSRRKKYIEFIQEQIRRENQTEDKDEEDF